MSNESVSFLDVLDSPKDIRTVLDQVLRKLDDPDLEQKTGHYVSNSEIKGLLKRDKQYFEEIVTCETVDRLLIVLGEDTKEGKALVGLRDLFQKNIQLAEKIKAANGFAEADAALKGSENFPLTGIVFRAIFGKALAASQKKQVLGYKCFSDLHSKKIEANRKPPLMEVAKSFASMSEVGEDVLPQLKGFVQRFKAARNRTNVDKGEMHQLRIIFSSDAFLSAPAPHKRLVNQIFSRVGHSVLFKDVPPISGQPGRKQAHGRG